MAADHDVIAAQALGAGVVRHVLEQAAKGFARVVLGIVLGPEGGEQVADHIADGVGDHTFPRPRSAAKTDAELQQLARVIVLAQHLGLRRAVAEFFAKEGAAFINLAAVAQGTGADRRPAGCLHRLQGGFFRVGVPGDAGDDPLGIAAANQRADQGGRQAQPEAVVLVTDGKAVIQVVVGIQRDRHGIGEQRLGVLGTEVFIVKDTHW